MQIFRHRWLFPIVVAMLAMVLLWLLLSYAVAYRFTHRLVAQAEESIPAITWGTLLPLRLQTRDGEELGAWFLRGRDSLYAVLLLHENWKDRSSRLEQAEMLARNGHSVLLLTFRAHGDSTGEVNDFGYSARADVIAAVEWLENDHPGRPIIVWGGSLGSAAAMFAAEELGQRVCGYILECPYRDLDTAVRNRTRHYLPQVLDWIAYRGLLAVAPVVLPDWDKISPLEAAKGIPEAVPVLILAGTADSRALPDEARAIHDCLKSHSQLVFFEGCDHMKLHVDAPERYVEAIRSFIGSLKTTPREPRR